MTLKKTMVVASGVFASLGMFAADFTWTGAAGNGDWTDGANWGGTAPGASDTAIFTAAATVTPPASFVGLIRVSGNECLTVDVPSDRGFSLALGTVDFKATGASFRKTGSGKLTLRANAGINPGTVTIAEGEVAFAGNGLEPAGAFDRVVLENGVTASVIESPVATRHAYAYRIAQGEKIDNNGMLAYDVESIVRAFDEWRFVPGSATHYSGNQVVGDDASVFDVGSFPYDAYRLFENKADIMVYYRGLFISESSESRRWYVTQTVGNGASIRIGFNQRPVCGTWKKPEDGAIQFWPTPTTMERGWAALTYMSGNDLRCWSPNWYIGYAFNLTHTPTYEGDTGRLTGSKLWNGVAFTGLEVKDGASLTVTDGQAMAIANARAFKMNGSFTGSASAYLYLASDWSETDGDAKLSAAALRGFAGTVDLAPTAKLGGETATSPVPYTLTGEGELTVTAANRDQVSSYAGALSLATNVTLDSLGAPSSAELTEKSVTWRLGGNAALVNDETAVRVLDKTSTVSDKERVSIIATEGVPVYCPFEFSCDVYMPNWKGFATDYWDIYYGLFVQADGPTLTYNNSMWSSRLGYMLPANKLAFGAYETGYASQSVSWVTNTLSNVSDPNNNTKLYAGNNSGANTWRYTENKPMRWTLSYDGFGSFTSSIQTNATAGGALVTHFTYPQLTQKKYSATLLYPSFLGCSTTIVYGKSTYSSVLVSNLTVKVLSTPRTETRRVTVEPGATLNVKVGQVDAAAGTPAVAFEGLTLSEGAALTYAPYWTGLVSGLDLTGVTLVGAATVSPAANESLTTTVGDLTTRNGGRLTVGGAATVKTPLTVTASREELKAVKESVPVVTFLDVAPALDVANVSVVDLDASGKTIDVSYSGGKLKLNASAGLLVVFR